MLVLVDFIYIFIDFLPGSAGPVPDSVTISVYSLDQDNMRLVSKAIEAKGEEICRTVMLSSEETQEQINSLSQQQVINSLSQQQVLSQINALSQQQVLSQINALSQQQVINSLSQQQVLSKINSLSQQQVLSKINSLSQQQVLSKINSLSQQLVPSKIFFPRKRFPRHKRLPQPKIVSSSTEVCPT